MQAALRTLSEADAIELSSHGHQGTRLVARHPGRLWAAASRGAPTGIMPLPSSVEFAGLASALAERFEWAGVPLSLAFRQGGHTRVRFLEAGRADFIVCSVAFAETLAADRFEARPLTPFSFYGRDSVVVITRPGEPPRPEGRVPIDPRSHDHSQLTEAEFPDATYTECAYPQIPELIVRGEVEAAVWHRTSASPLLTAAGLEMHPLSRSSPAEGERFSTAALVTLVEADPPAGPLLDAVVEVGALAAVQGEVVRGERVPAF